MEFQVAVDKYNFDLNEKTNYLISISKKNDKNITQEWENCKIKNE